MGIPIRFGPETPAVLTAYDNRMLTIYRIHCQRYTKRKIFHSGQLLNVQAAQLAC